MTQEYGNIRTEWRSVIEECKNAGICHEVAAYEGKERAEATLEELKEAVKPLQEFMDKHGYFLDTLVVRLDSFELQKTVMGQSVFDFYEVASS